MNYYWTYFLLPSTVAQLAPGRAFDVQRCLETNAILSGVLMLAALFLLARTAVRQRALPPRPASRWSCSPPAPRASTPSSISCPRGRPLSALLDMNIDAVTNWSFGGLRIDNVPRSLWYTPQHTTSIALGHRRPADRCNRRLGRTAGHGGARGSRTGPLDHAEPAARGRLRNPLRHLRHDGRSGNAVRLALPTAARDRRNPGCPGRAVGRRQPRDGRRRIGPRARVLRDVPAQPGRDAAAVARTGARACPRRPVAGARAGTPPDDPGARRHRRRTVPALLRQDLGGVVGRVPCRAAAADLHRGAPRAHARCPDDRPPYRAVRRRAPDRPADHRHRHLERAGHREPSSGTRLQVDAVDDRSPARGVRVAA